MSKNATSIWSGYNHQGKVGLIVALAEIDRLIESNDNEKIVEELKKWKLVYEGAEDFDILNDSATVWSRHQVKAWTNKNQQSNYTEVLKKFNTSSTRSGHCYLHVIENIPAWNDNSTSNSKRIKLYTYPVTNKKYCQFSEVEDVLDVLYEIYEPLMRKIIDTDDSHMIKALWASLEHLLEDRIRHAHKTKSKPEFSFIEIYDFLIEKNPLVASNCQTVRKRLTKFWERHEKQKASAGEEFDSNWHKAKDLLEKLLAFDDPVFIKAIRIMNPNEEESDFHPEFNGVRKVVYRAFEEVNKDINLENMTYSAEDIYVLTALIGDDMGKVYAEEICSHIIKNPSFAEQLYIESKLITADLSGNLFAYLKSGNNEHLLYKSSSLGGMQAEHIRNFANLEFIEVNDAVNSLNGTRD